MRVGVIAVVLYFCVPGVTGVFAQDTATAEATQTSVLAEETSDASSPSTVISTSDQVAEQFSRQDLFYLPMGLQWELYPIDGQPWWIDFSKFPWLQDLKALSLNNPSQCLSPPQYGVQALRLNLSLELLTGEIVVRSEC